MLVFRSRIEPDFLNIFLNVHKCRKSVRYTRRRNARGWSVPGWWLSVCVLVRGSHPPQPVPVHTSSGRNRNKRSGCGLVSHVRHDDDVADDHDGAVSTLSGCVELKRAVSRPANRMSGGSHSGSDCASNHPHRCSLAFISASPLKDTPLVLCNFFTGTCIGSLRGSRDSEAIECVRGILRPPFPPR